MKHAARPRRLPQATGTVPRKSHLRRGHEPARAPTIFPGKLIVQHLTALGFFLSRKSYFGHGFFGSNHVPSGPHALRSSLTSAHERKDSEPLTGSTFKALRQSGISKEFS